MGYYTFDKTDLDYYLFFEDDMFFHPKDGVCRNGFNRYIPNLYTKSLEIIKKENFDFLKMNYSEFYETIPNQRNSSQYHI